MCLYVSIRVYTCLKSKTIDTVSIRVYRYRKRISIYIRFYGVSVRSPPETIDTPNYRHFAFLLERGACDARVRCE